MDIYDLLFKEITSLADLLGLHDTSAIVIEPVKDFKYGDVATNLAILLSKASSVPIDEAASIIIEKLSLIPYIESAVCINGFVNCVITDQVCHSIIKKICEEKSFFANSNIGNNENLNLEFISANPTGPLHIGHIRGAVIFNSIANVMKKVGFIVTKEYYVNDFGSQIDILAYSVYLRYKEILEKCDFSAELEGFYPGEYVKDIASSLIQNYGDFFLHADDKERNSSIKAFAINAIMNLIKNDLKILDIDYDVFTYESRLHEEGIISKGIALLEQKGLVYKGFIAPPKEKHVKEKEDVRELILFKATVFGDDVDRSLQKDDGNWSYFAADLGYHYDKISRGFKKMIVGLGADHIGYVKRLTAIVNALTDGVANINVFTYNIVNFLKNGKPFKLSKREGNVITISDIMENIDINTLKCAILTRKSDVMFNFDFTKFKAETNDNPVFYIQYAYARTNSIIKRYLSVFSTDILDFSHVDLSLINHKDELKIIKLLAKWPKVVKSVARDYEPHRIVFYLQEVAECFHHLWHNGVENENLRFIIEDNIELTRARVMLVYSTQVIMHDALQTIGIVPTPVM